MNPIDAIDPTGAAGTALKTSRLSLETMAAEPPSVEALAQRFQALMQGPHHADNMAGVDGPNMVSEVLTRGEDMLQQNHALMRKLQEESAHLSPVEMIHKTIEATRQISESNFRLQMATTLSSNTNKSLQTLLKNQ